MAGQVVESALPSDILEEYDVGETLGTGWLTPDRFRLGASSLLNDVLLQLAKLDHGRYGGPDYVTVD